MLFWEYFHCSLYFHCDIILLHITFSYSSLNFWSELVSRIYFPYFLFICFITLSSVEFKYMPDLFFFFPPWVLSSLLPFLSGPPFFLYLYYSCIPQFWFLSQKFFWGALTYRVSLTHRFWEFLGADWSRYFRFSTVYPLHWPAIYHGQNFLLILTGLFIWACCGLQKYMAIWGLFSS